MIDYNSSYKDLATETDILETRIRDMEREREFLRRSMYANAPVFNGVVDYSKDSVQNGYVPMSLDRILERLNKIDDSISMVQEVLKAKKDALRQVQTMIEKFEGLEYKVAYMRDMEGMRLQEIADKLGYSYDWIRKISSRIKKAHKRHKNMDKPIV
jgi:DNA repair ATPase RecN